MQNLSDQSVNFILILLILLHLAALGFGYLNTKGFIGVAVLNTVIAASLIAFFLFFQLLVKKHFLESIEIMALLFEILVFGAGLKFIFSDQQNKAWKIINSLFFGVHLMVLIAGLVFMLSFKMDRLF